MYDEFVEFQRAIGGTLDRIEAALAAGGVEAIATLGRSRWQLGQELHRYRAFMLNQLLPPVETREDARGEMARGLRQRCDDAAACFSDHVTTWDVVSMIDDWAGYQPAALAGAARLRARLEQEHADIAWLLDIPVSACTLKRSAA